MSKPVRLVFLADDSQLQSALKRMIASTSATQAALRKLEKTGADLSRIGRTMTIGITAPTLAAATAAVVLATRFDETMLHIQTLAGASADQIKTWSGQLLSLGPALGKSPQELANALYFLVSSGIDVKIALDAVTASAKASAIGLGDTQTIADAVSSAMNAYGAANLSAAHATDILLRSVKDGKAEPAALAQSIGLVIPLAAQMGVGFDQVAGAMAALTQTGSTAAEASTQLRNIFNAILKPSAGVSAELKKIRLSSADLQTELRQKGLLATLDDLQKRTGGNQQAFAKLFPNIRGLLGVLSLVGPNGEKAAAAMQDVAKAGGDVNAAFALQKQQPVQKFKEALASLQATGIELGNKLAPSAARLAEQFAHLVDRFSQLSPKTQDIILKIIGLVAVMGPLLYMTGSTIRVFSQLAKHPIITAIALLVIAFITAYTTSATFRDKVHEVVDALIKAGKWVKDNSTWLLALASSAGTFLVVARGFSFLANIGGLAVALGKGLRVLVTVIESGLLTAVRYAGVAFRGLQAAWLALNTSFLASPIGIVIAIIAALAVAFYIAYTHSATFRRIVQEALHAVVVAAKWAWDGIVAGAMVVWGWINKYLVPVFKALWAAGVAAFNGLMKVLAPVINFFNTVRKAILDAVTTISTYIHTHFEAIKKTLMVVGAVIFGPLILAIGIVIGVWKLLSFVVPPILQVIWAVISFTFKAIWVVISTVMKAIWFVVGPILKFLWETWVFTMKIIWAVVSSIFKLIWAIIVAVLRLILIVWKATWDNFTYVFGLVYGVVKTIVMFLVNLFVTIFASIYDVIAKVVKSVWGFIKEWFGKIKDAVSGPLEAVKSAVETAWSWIEKHIVDPVVRIYNAVKDWFGKMGKAAGEALGSIGGAVKGAINTAIRAVNQIHIPQIKVGGQVIFDGWAGPQLPLLANGGIITSPTIAMVGEAGAELVLPLTRKQRAMDLLAKSGLLSDLPQGGGSTSSSSGGRGGGKSVHIENLIVHSQATNTDEIGRDVAWQVRAALA